MDSTDLVRLDATAQADLVRRGEVTPVELVEAAIEAVERLDPQLGAVFIPTPEHALDTPARCRRTRRSRGSPILVKDMALELEGYPYGHGGLRLLRDRGYVSDRTTYLAAGLRDAGFAFLGRSTSALQGVELGVHDLDLHTMPRNPWNTDYATGGSSSGSATAVAAGLVPLAHGNDGGGSLRMPAAICGLVTLKPTRGRVSPGPLIGATNSVGHAWIEEFVLTPRCATPPRRCPCSVAAAPATPSRPPRHCARPAPGHGCGSGSPPPRSWRSPGTRPTRRASAPRPRPPPCSPSWPHRRPGRPAPLRHGRAPLALRHVRTRADHGRP